MRLGPVNLYLRGTNVVVELDADNDEKPSVSISIDVGESIDEVRNSLDDLL